MTDARWPTIAPPHPDALPTLTLPAQDLMSYDGTGPLPETIVLDASDGRRFTFDQSDELYWELLDVLHAVWG